MLIMADFIPFDARNATQARQRTPGHTVLTGLPSCGTKSTACNVIKDNANELKLNGKKKCKKREMKLKLKCNAKCVGLGRCHAPLFASAPPAAVCCQLTLHVATCHTLTLAFALLTFASCAILCQTWRMRNFSFNIPILNDFSPTRK